MLRMYSYSCSEVQLFRGWAVCQIAQLKRQSLSVHRRQILVIGGVLGHHHAQHHSGVADAQLLALAALELHQRTASVYKSPHSNLKLRNLSLGYEAYPAGPALGLKADTMHRLSYPGISLGRTLH